MQQNGRVSGRLAIFSVYGLALVMAGLVFWFGKREKREWDHISVPGLAGDTVVVDHPDSLRALVSSWPRSFTQVSRISGPTSDRFAVVVPCFSETPSLSLGLDSLSAPTLQCPFCEFQDTMHLLAVRVLRRAPLAQAAQADTNPPLYSLQLSVQSSPQVSTQDTVQDSLEVAPADSLQGRSFRDLPVFVFAPAGRVILHAPTQTLTGPAMGAVNGQDTTWFLPQDGIGLLETVRAEDENPEGCNPE
jgi:hypothetical protein